MPDRNGEPHNFRFLGLTKFQFMIGLVAFFAATTIISIATLAWSVSANSSQASSEREQVLVARALVVENKKALCGLKNYAQKQVENTSDYLARNRSDTPIPGISRSQLISQLERQREFRDSMKGLDCE